ncbi:MAG: zinc ribbon domain-containing protein [Bifidobacterium dentium]
MGMIACPECGTSISDRARVCMNCGYCGTEVDRPIGEQNEEISFRISMLNSNVGTRAVTRARSWRFR